ncbi:Gfo/Idh/MocA family protein [Sagittula sp. SSi028]|uniref:Gfo/Idh/MocA family protein n=1 Tax=Sagittula sp. SSi028 TaxID=3400636 RepID=UPI003AF9B6E7
MADHVRWGILGAAKFAREHMGRAIHAAERGELAALATSSTEKAAPFQAFVPGLRVHLSYDDLLADPEIDAVYIPLPNHLHVEYTQKALAAGKHVLVEKPMAMAADEFDAVIAERDRSGLLAAEAYMVVHHPQWIKARELVQSGAIGRLRRVSGAFSYDNSADAGNIRNDAAKGGGAVPDIGVYIYGTARFVTGEEPQEILSTEIERENGVDIWTHVTARFPSFHYSGVVSMRMAPFQEMLFHGDKGVLRLSAPFNPQVYGQAELELRAKDGGLQVWRFPAVNHYVRQVEAFNASVLDGADYPCPLEFSRGTQAMIDMIWAHDRG